MHKHCKCCGTAYDRERSEYKKSLNPDFNVESCWFCSCTEFNVMGDD